MNPRFHVRVANDSLLFSAGHFITLADGVCESLHGHDYRVAVEIAGPLVSQGFVVDFIAVEKLLHEVLAAWDHQVLLPLDHPQIRVSVEGDEVSVTFADRRWLFPRRDCQLLPVANTTSERLAELLAGRLHELCPTRLGIRPDHIRVEIGESCGQTAICDWGGG